jgi:SnoaL-like domain
MCQGDMAADHRAIRALIDAYAHFADRRRPEEQAALYAEDGRTFVYHGDPSTSEPVQVLVGRAEHAEGFKVLSQYVATTHFNGQNTVTLDGDRATGETYCLAHHLLETDGSRTLIVMSIRYEDTFVKQGGTWLFAERKLIIDWTDTRSSQP